MSVTAEEYQEKVKSVTLSDALKRATDSAYGSPSRASSPVASESEEGATASSPGPIADKQRTAPGDDARDVPASPPVAAPFRSFATEEEWNAHLAAEAEKHKSRVRAEQSEWDRLKKSERELSQGLKEVTQERNALTIALNRLKEEGVSAARQQLLQTAVTRGVSEGDIYQTLESLDPQRFQSEELRRLAQWRAQEAEREQQEATASAAQEAEWARVRDQLASDTALAHERAIARVITVAAKVQIPLDETSAAALLQEVSAGDAVAHDLYQDWQESAAQGDVPKARRKAETSFRHLISLAEAEITRRAVAKTNDERPPLTAYDRRTVGGPATSGGPASGGKDVPGVGHYPFATDRAALTTLDAAVRKQMAGVRQWRDPA